MEKRTLLNIDKQNQQEFLELIINYIVRFLRIIYFMVS